MLLTPEEVDTVMGTTGMARVQAAHAAWSTAGTLSNPDCLESLYAGQEQVYESSGYNAISVVELTEQAHPVNYVSQAVVGFPSADLALEFVKKSAGKMRTCAGQNITETQSGLTLQWTVGDLVGDVPTITQLSTVQSGKACQRALRGLSNLVVDVTACGRGVSDQGRQIADQMAAKATHCENYLVTST